jgi:hypothetical protein
LWVLLGAGLMVAAGVLGPHKEQRARGWPRVWPRVWIGSVVVLWLLGAFLQYLSGRFLFRYHQVILVPAAAVLLTAGLVGLAGATRRLEQRARPLLVRALSITALVAVGWFVLVNAKLVDELRVTAQWATGSVSTDEVYSRFGHRLWYYSYPDQRALAAYVHRATAPGDAVHMIGRGGLFYLYVDRRPASRYLVTKGVFDRRRPTAEARIAEFVAELERARPRYILIRRDDAFPWFGLPSSLDQVRQEPRILAFLRQHYAFEDAPFPRVVVLKRTDDGGR